MIRCNKPDLELKGSDAGGERAHRVQVAGKVDDGTWQSANPGQPGAVPLQRLGMRRADAVEAG